MTGDNGRGGLTGGKGVGKLGVGKDAGCGWEGGNEVIGGHLEHVQVFVYWFVFASVVQVRWAQFLHILH